MNSVSAHNPGAHRLARRAATRLGALARVLAAVGVSGALTPAALATDTTGGSHMGSTDTTYKATNIISTTSGNTIDFEVRGWSEGDSPMLIYVQQKNSAGNYDDMGYAVLHLDGTGDVCTTTFSYTVTNHRSGSTEYVRLKFGKTIFSARIDFWWKGTY